ncbi:MAG: hypothetical protein Q7T43_15165, partial [Rhodoferax sp.]|nr:hypothetical protein [Rhodoferax sp.]
TRRGDQAMCVRFWGEITREKPSAVRHRLSARAFHPKARSHDQITTPDGVGRKGCLGAGLQFERNVAERLEA